MAVAKMRTVTIILLFALVLPCLLIGQQTVEHSSVAEEDATIYFYRKPEFLHGRFDCWVDDVRLISTFRAASYFWLNLPAGDYEIRTNGKPTWSIAEKKYQLKVEAGQVYYIEAIVDYDFLGTALLLQERSQADFDRLEAKITFDERAVRLLE